MNTRHLTFFSTGLLTAVLVAIGLTTTHAAQRPALSDSDITDIAQLVKLEDTRQFDATELSRLLASKHPEVRRRAVISVGRIVNPGGGALLESLRKDADPEIVASVAFAYGQLKNAAAVGWLGQTLMTPTTRSVVGLEAARALGKIRTPQAWAALAAYLAKATGNAGTAPVVGEALLSLGRFTTPEETAGLAKWAASPNVELRWRATWALYRPRNPAALPLLYKLSQDDSPEVRFWAVRGLAPALVDTAKVAGLDRGATSARLRALVKDPDRRVRTEALRALGAYEDDASFAVVLASLDDADSWMSVSAAEALGLMKSRAEVIVPKLTAVAADESKPAALRTVARQQVARLNPPPPASDAAGQTGRAGGARQGGARAGGGGQTPAAAAPARTDADYRAIVERWIVPAYNGAKAPHAIWMTPKGEIEMELHAAEAPLGMEELVRLTESGDIVGTAFTRVVPNFVAQQATIRGANRLRDEVSRLGLTRANLAWASSGLDTGRPGYTLGSTPQAHNEGDFTALGLVVRGMDVVDRLELGDTVTAAKIVK